MSWKTYFKNTKGNPPRKLLVKALSYVNNNDTALDIGAGALNESAYLLSRGFMDVTAIDQEPIAKEIADSLPKDSFFYITSKVENYTFPKNRFDLINAQYSLPFIQSKALELVLGNIHDSLKLGGIFTGQFFGNNDEWSDDDNMSFHTHTEVEKILSKYESIFFREEEKKKETAEGKMKHWHIFEFIVRKK